MTHQLKQIQQLVRELDVGNVHEIKRQMNQVLNETEIEDEEIDVILDEIERCTSIATGMFQDLAVKDMISAINNAVKVDNVKKGEFIQNTVDILQHLKLNYNKQHLQQMFNAFPDHPSAQWLIEQTDQGSSTNYITSKPRLLRHPPTPSNT
eukprot:1106534_1